MELTDSQETDLVHEADLSYPATHVLVLEDEELMAALIGKYLQRSAENLGESFVVETLPSGWDLLTQDLSHVRVAIIDILLPNITGVDLIRDFRRRYPSMGLVPISGMATEPMKRQLREILPDSVNLLPKPLRKSDFMRAFEEAWKKTLFIPKQSPQPEPLSTKEAKEEPIWSAVPTHSQQQVPVVQRRLSRKKAA